MTEIYSAIDLEKAKKQKNKCLAVFFSVSLVYLAAAVFMLVYFILEPYGTTKRTPLIIGEGVLTAVYVIFIYIFMAIKFARVKNYVKLLDNLIGKNVTKSIASFMRFNGETTVKDRVDFTSMTFVEWSEKEKDYMERHVLLDKEKARPDFRPGDEVILYTRMNILVSYEVAERTVLEGTPFEN